MGDAGEDEERPLAGDSTGRDGRLDCVGRAVSGRQAARRAATRTEGGEAMDGRQHKRDGVDPQARTDADRGPFSRCLPWLLVTVCLALGASGCVVNPVPTPEDKASGGGGGMTGGGDNGGQFGGDVGMSDTGLTTGGAGDASASDAAAADTTGERADDAAAAPDGVTETGDDGQSRRAADGDADGGAHDGTAADASGDSP